ncbi:peptidase domain-containing ABC transporter [Romeria aff. gracilis LEGE 07310]|uniref:Peptidase domain-containing ABC transporter n=1 Tax=Vasconcelosia minhoensis LEGE 07310 TaxID=915328 RepID=A0A8J7DBW6_9CYAN|nr:peptidase domain-containing ABC transporter [Romeria gracilis]MBE9078262.1 peptidase domain-containing ABC transporter [Romeria aff. gracilis LEGE 07310]
MTTATTPIYDFLATTPPFDRLSPERLGQLASRVNLLRYRMGQAIVMRETLPAQVSILYEGQARLLGYSAQSCLPENLQLLRPGAVLGWVGLIRGVACETAIASVESVCLTLTARDFRTLVQQEPDFAEAFHQRCDITELYELLGAEVERRAIGEIDLHQIAFKLLPEAAILTLPQGKQPLSQLDPNLLWFLSGGKTNFLVGSRLDPDPEAVLTIESSSARLVGIRHTAFDPESRSDETAIADTPSLAASDAIPYAPERPPALDEDDIPTRKAKYPHIHGRGPVDTALACFQMLSRYWQMPFRRDVLRRALINQNQRNGSLSLQFCGAIAELMGLTSQLATVPVEAVSRLQTPIMLQWQGSFALLYKASEKELVLAIPEQGIRRMKPAAFVDSWGEEGEVLLLQPTKDTPKQKFGLSWFVPSVVRHRKVLIEVLLASFFVQLLTLANPLLTQTIIDKVIVQNSASTLNFLGTLLIVMSVFEALITGLRTMLFVDTTNRIDMALGSEVIDHLLRLPLRYFEKRPVGELSTRVNELENIRQFLTGTALTVVLDAVFSVIYIAVMLMYSVLLTVVALATVPLFALLTLTVAPVIRQQARIKAERNAETQSYLVEVVSGIQTVKAQNIELKSRWQWQDRYARYVSAGFKTVLTSTTAGSLSSFLNQLSSLLLLWVGAYLVLQGKLTLGQLIAFRIIASYTTSPLLRLIQLWQNFQETALSLERLSDILDTPQETEEADRKNIPMPDIQGSVRYENVCFRFSPNGPRQLDGIDLEIPKGLFVGVVGQSGAGKSTLTKLLPRLYDLESGRILIDGYDIHKVELYSLRRQIGTVLQDTLLFDTTVQENIALTNPDATPEEIVEAAKIAYAHDFIMDLPNGYNSRVGERGAALSGGQRQRIAIARTVLQNPRLLILDEATSALDLFSERQVCTNLMAAFRGRNVFFITHRLATIRNADRILMMDKGSIAEQGTHEELMAMQGLYYCLYQQQEASGE